MRQFFAIGLIILLAACDDYDRKEYSDLTGQWHFESDTFSGEFRIEKSGDGKLVVRNGTFTINGTTYSDVYNQELTISGFSVNPNIYMVDSSNEASLSLAFVTFSGNYQSMASQRQLVTDCDACGGSRLIDKTVEIIRR